MQEIREMLEKRAQYLQKLNKKKGQELLSGWGKVYPDFTLLNIRERKEIYSLSISFLQLRKMDRKFNRVDKSMNICLYIHMNR